MVLFLLPAQGPVSSSLPADWAPRSPPKITNQLSDTVMATPRQCVGDLGKTATKQPGPGPHRQQAPKTVYELATKRPISASNIHHICGLSMDKV